MYNILFDGDSITACYDAATNTDSMIGFPLVIKNQVSCNYQNNAVSGQTSSQLVENLNNNFIPDFYFLEIGANDAWEKIKYNKETTDEVFYNNLVQIINHIKSLNSSVKIIIQTIATSNKTSLSEEVIKKNRVIKKVAKEFNLVLFDTYSFFFQLDDNYQFFHSDEIHYKSIAHKLIANELLEYIK